jgi:GAF domain-containing protein
MPGGSPVSFFYNLLTKINENLSAEAEDLQTLREGVLNNILVAVSIFGAVALVVNAIPVTQSGNWTFLVIFSFAYLGVLITTINHRIPYSFRATVIILIPMGLAITDFIDLGLSGDGMVWLFTSILLTSILSGPRWTLINWVFQVFILFAFAIFIISGRLVVSFPDSTSVLSWLELGMDYILLGFIAITGIHLLVKGLEKSLITTRQMSVELTTHTDNLERRLTQIRTVAEISRTINSELASENFLQRIADVIQERLNLYYVGLFLVDEKKEFAVLKAGTGTPGKEMLTKEHKLEVGGTSMIGWSIANEEPRIALEVGQEAVRFENPLLPLTRSELAIPLKSSTDMFGALSVQSTESQAFDQDDIFVLEGLADSIATAIENARLFEQTQKQVEELNILYNASLSMYSSVQGQDALLTIAQHMLKVSGTQNYVISTWDIGQDEIVTMFGFTPNEDVSGEFGKRYKLSDYPLTEKVLRERQIVTVRVDDPQADSAEVALLKQEGLKSLLMVPLVAHGKVTGLIELHDVNICRDFSPKQINLVEALSAQAAVVLEITDLIEQNRQTARNERIINKISSKFQQITDVEGVLTTTIVELSNALGLKEAIIQLVSDSEILSDSVVKENGHREGL